LRLVMNLFIMGSNPIFSELDITGHNLMVEYLLWEKVVQVQVLVT
jgi:hypothetical protein